MGREGLGLIQGQVSTTRRRFSSQIGCTPHLHVRGCASPSPPPRRNLEMVPMAQRCFNSFKRAQCRKVGLVLTPGIIKEHTPSVSGAGPGITHGSALTTCPTVSGGNPGSASLTCDSCPQILLVHTLLCFHLCFKPCVYKEPI